MTAFQSRTRSAMARTVGIAAAIVLGLLPATAHAQNAAKPTKWTIEFFGGGSSSSESSSGTAIDGFTVGAPFVMESGPQSRAVSSWFFGDGALLLNQTLAQFSAITGTTLPPIAPLDAALLATGGKRGNGGVFGIRLGRQVSNRLAIELSVERGLSSLGLTDELKKALQDGSDSFKAAFEALLATAPAANVNVTSMLTLSDGSKGQTRIALAGRWTVLAGDRLEGYVTGGGGVSINGSEGPSAVLNGRYRFGYFNLFPIDETDRVAIRVEQPKNSLMGLVGGGATYGLSSTLGLRADVRLLLHSTKDVTRLTTAPLIATNTPLNVMSSVTSPGVQFSTRPGVRSSLSGDNENLTLFRASGLSKQITFTIGVFKRF